MVDTLPPLSPGAPARAQLATPARAQLATPARAEWATGYAIIGSGNSLRGTRTIALFGLLYAASAAYGHHSFAMFEMSKNLTFKGAVVEYNWENPHTHIIIKVPDSAGKETAGTWDIEGGAVNIMAKQGWTKTTFKPGDPITIVGHPMKDGTKAASLFYAILPDGKRLYHDIARPNADGSAPPPSQP